MVVFQQSCWKGKSFFEFFKRGNLKEKFEKPRSIVGNRDRPGVLILFFYSVHVFPLFGRLLPNLLLFGK